MVWEAAVPLHAELSWPKVAEVLCNGIERTWPASLCSLADAQVVAQTMSARALEKRLVANHNKKVKVCSSTVTLLSVS